MAADEQQFLMDRIAQLEQDGKVEALKERRNHIHVFVFPDGQSRRTRWWRSSWMRWTRHMES
jgi:hypothetical protein